MLSLNRFLRLYLPAFLLALAIALGSGARALPPATPATAPAVVPTTAPDAATPASVAELRSMQSKIENVVKKCLPATVAILTTSGEGSGVIISKDGLVLTAAHVIEGPNIRVVVVLPSGKQLRARTLGTDHSADTGMVKIVDAGEYPFVEVGQSSQLKRGEWVVALGHPGGYQPAQNGQPARPPVARLGRILAPIILQPNMLNTDCTIIMGDSGGPLFDLEGHLVGIHSRIAPGSSTNMHVPVDAFLQSWQRLARGDDWGADPLATVRRARPGSMGAELGFTGVDDPKGCRVDTLGTNGAKIGLKVNDIITKLDGKPIDTGQTMHDELDTYRAGQRVNIELLRDGNVVHLTVTLAARP